MGMNITDLPRQYQRQVLQKTASPEEYEKLKQLFEQPEKQKDPKRQMRGSINRALGATFEEQLIAACDYYRAHGHAEIDKTPEPTKIVSGRHQNQRGTWVFDCIFTKQAQPDFQGTLQGGRSVVFEAKISDGDRIEQHVVTKEQNRALESHARMGAMAFVMVCLRGRAAYRVTWEVWSNMQSQYGRKYMTADDLEPYTVAVRYGLILFLGDIGEVER